MILFFNSFFFSNLLKEIEGQNLQIEEIKLICQDGELGGVPTILLAAHSLLLRQIILNGFLNFDEEEQKYFIKLPYIKAEIMAIILNYMYNNHVIVPSDDLNDVLRAAYLLQVNSKHFCYLLNLILIMKFPLKKI